MEEAGTSSLKMWKIWQQGTSREATFCRSDAFYDAVCQQWQGMLSAVSILFVTWVSMLVLLLLPLELPKKILDSYLLLIAEKKYKETHKQDSRFNAPSVTRAITKTMLLLISIKIKNAKKIKSVLCKML